MKRVAKKEIKKQRFRKLARTHAIFTMIIFGLYLTLSSVYGVEFIFSDMREKFTAFADDVIVLTAKVLGPPVQPVVSGTSVCSNGNLSVALDWADDENSETFDIARDGETLITGLIDSQYSDSLVALNSTYNYVVTAKGVMDPGQAVSQVVSVTTMEECKIILPPPVVNITAFNNKSVFSYGGTPATTLKRPTFSGTTNIPNAIIKIELHSGIIIVADVIANGVGYWEWSPLVDISLGAHQLLVSAQDPEDILRKSDTTFDFIVESVPVNEADSDTHDNKKKNDSNTTSRHGAGKTAVIKNNEQKAPFDFMLSLQNNSIFQGDELMANIEMQNLLAEHIGTGAEAEYRIFNNDGIKVFEDVQAITLSKELTIDHNIQVPKYFKDGKYKLQVNIISNKFNISQEKAFTVLPVPFLNLGGGTVMTYPDFLSRLGMIGLWLFISLIVWLFVFMREYWLYLHAWRHITERSLDRLGLFGIRKRRGVSH